MLRLILGPMYAGKTTDMCRRVERAELGKKSTLIVRHATDNRYETDTIVNHMRHQFHSRVIQTDRLGAVRNELDSVDVIGIDEGQFYCDLKEEVLRLLSMNKEVIIAALDSDVNQCLFHDVIALIPFATSVKKLTAICESCRSRDAVMNRFRQTKTDETTTNVIQVGGKETYTVVCYACRHKI